MSIRVHGMTPWVMVLALTAALGVACSSQHGNASADSASTTQGSSGGGSSGVHAAVLAGAYVLRVSRAYDRAAGGGPTLPAEEIPESAYHPVTTPVQYTVTFEADGRGVSVHPASGADMHGHLTTERAGYTQYDLDSGTFAGGRLVVRTTGDARDAELTVYGSGVPVVRSERGPLGQ